MLEERKEASRPETFRGEEEEASALDERKRLWRWSSPAPGIHEPTT
jgi:hypothetical protein